MITHAWAGGNETLPSGWQRLIIPLVIRRLHVPKLFVGVIPLKHGQARHARDVLRLAEGTSVEVFDDRGAVATGTLIFDTASGAQVRIDRIEPAGHAFHRRVVIASAVPKGERADWMVEKLSELGVAEFIPLITGRAVVKPEGRNKKERWMRLATESAKQSRRIGVMRIAELTKLDDLLADPRASETTSRLHLSTNPGAAPLTAAIGSLSECQPVLLLIGPEGGWTEAEIGAFEQAGIPGVKLTPTILRIETAAVAAGVIALLATRGPRTM